MEKAKDSAILARLIYRSYCNTDPPVIDMTVGPFCDSLEFYAKTRIRELIDEGKLELVSDSDAAPPATEEAPPVPVPATKTDRPPEGARYEDAAQPADTHTHTPQGPMTAKAQRPPPSPEKDRARKKRSSSI